MDTQDVAMVIETAERWFGAQGAPVRPPLAGADTPASFDLADGAADRQWHAFAELGWLGLSIPEADGGFGADLITVLTFIRLAARHECQSPLDLHLVLAPLLLQSIDDAAKRAGLAQELIEGSVRLAMADGPCASHTPDVVTARRLAFYGGQRATHAVLWVSDPHAESGAWLLDCQALGGGLQRARWLDGRPNAVAAQIEVAVQAFGTAGRLVPAYACVAQIADACGTFEAAFALTLDYLKQREQFGRPLAALQVVQHRMADVFCDLQQLLALVDRLGRADDAWSGVDPITLAAAKSHVGRRALRGVGQLIQLSGGIGVTDDYRLGRLYKRLHVAAALFVSSEAALQSLDAKTALLPA
ncbi:acyl-CoA dehydrogenase [Schauerella aestuarii]|uniref:acyl-CoA dehydrogenase n=1 Tax=Schauerella aestuarii TaxID=2511204 RepID=UPI0013695751|nr:acyl-CoA dehydrogenase [Achromobacter aestuarii]MYZ42794.1 hypothetical protein [Achromobacter aestuarii]